MMITLPPPCPEIEAPAAAAAERDYYSVSQAAALLGVSRVTIWRWIRAGRLAAARLGHRTVRIKREDVERALARVEPAESQAWVGETLAAGSAASGQLAPRSNWGEVGASEHLVQFYESDAFLLDGVSEFIGRGLRAGEPGIVIATKAHRAGLAERLEASGLDLAAARRAGRYVSLDAAETLAKFMVNGTPDAERFAEVIGNTVARATQGGRRARAFGEMVALLALEGNQAAAVRLEQLWNDLQQVHSFALFCAYPMDDLGGDGFAELVGDLCSEHSRVIPAESYSGMADPDDRLRVIALLQQKARTLQSEVAERQQAEKALYSLFRISQKLHASLDLETLLDHVVEEALQLVGAEGGCAGLRTPEGMVCQKYFDKSGVVPLTYCWPAGHGLPGWLLEHKVPYITNDALADDQIVQELWRTFGVRSALSTPILDARGEPLGFFQLHNKVDGSGFTQADLDKLTAVSQVASIAIQNARLYQEAQDAVRLRDEFLSIASHELRTPLTTVRAHAQIMLRRLARDGSADPAAVEGAFGSIAEQTSKLSRLVEQLLDVSRLESRKLSLEPQLTDLGELIERVAAAARVRTQQRIVVQAPDSVLARVDPLRLDQTLTNLLDNAIKYGADNGPIEVALRVGARCQVSGTSGVDAPEPLIPDTRHSTPTFVEIAVRDRGPGIPEEKRDGVFERFFQAHAEGYKSGMGLGLYISRQIAELHGGEIRAEFPPDGGTRFVVRLPVGVAEPAVT